MVVDCNSPLPAGVYLTLLDVVPKAPQCERLLTGPLDCCKSPFSQPVVPVCSAVSAVAETLSPYRIPFRGGRFWKKIVRYDLANYHNGFYEDI